MNDHNESFSTRFWAIVDCEVSDCSFDESIVLMMPSKERANEELGRRQTLSPDDDDYVDAYHAVLPVHVDGVGWNSLEPVPDWWPHR